MNAWEVYLLTRLVALQESLSTPLTVTAVLTAVSVAGYLISFAMLGEGYNTTIGEEYGKKFKVLCSQVAKWAASVCSGLWFIKVLCPSVKDLALIFALSWASNSEQVSNLPDKVIKVVNGYLDYYIEDLENAVLEEKKKKKKQSEKEKKNDNP